MAPFEASAGGTTEEELGLSTETYSRIDASENLG